MTSLQRLTGMLILVALITSPALARAQDEILRAAGSGVVAPVFEAILAASGVTVPVETTVSGTRGGLQQLCAGTVDFALASRAIDDLESNACTAAGISFLELTLGDFAVAVIVNPSDDFAQCLSDTALNLVFAPGAAGQVTDWRAVSADAPAVPLTVILPPNDAPAYAVFDGLVEGVGLRTDAVTQSDPAAIIDLVSMTSGALGVVDYAAAVNAGDQIKILQLSQGTNPCLSPSADTILSGQYPVRESLYLYANTAALEKPGASQLLAFIASEPAANIVSELGFVPPDTEMIERAQSIIANRQTGRQFSIPRAVFSIPPSVSGALNYGGSTAGFSFIQLTTNAFQAQYAGVTHNLNFDGQIAGARRFCNGELQFLMLSAPLTEEQAGNCTANNLTPVSFDLGREAVVLLANPRDQYLTCLTTEQLVTIWNASATGTITSWDQVDSSFPAAAMTLLTPREGDDTSDLLMTRAAGLSRPVRTDAVTNGDPLYRAASVAVADASLTYTRWRAYPRVLERGDADVRLVAIDGGAGCVEPSEATIADGSYPISRPVQLVTSEQALVRPDVQSVLWFIFSDTNFSRITNAGFVGLELSALPAIRETLQDRFEAAAAAQAAPEPTPQAEPEVEAQSGEAVDPTPTSAG